MITILLVALIAAVDPSSVAPAIGGSYLFRATGSVLGISLSTAILQNTLSADLSRSITGKGAKQIIQRIRLDVSYINQLHGRYREAAIEAYASAFHDVFWFIFITALLTLVRRVDSSELTAAALHVRDPALRPAVDASCSQEVNNARDLHASSLNSDASIQCGRVRARTAVVRRSL